MLRPYLKPHRFCLKNTKCGYPAVISTCRSIGFVIRWTILFLCCYISGHCALRPTPRDLTAYINRDIYGIAELEEMALKRYGELTGDNYISDEALRTALEAEIIPAYKRFATLAESVKPQTKPVQRLHGIYRKAAALRLQGFRMVLLALETQDPDLVRQANRMLKQGQHFIAQWQASMTDMTEQYGLALK